MAYVLRIPNLDEDMFPSLKSWSRNPKVCVHAKQRILVHKRYIGPSQAEQLLRVTSAIAAELIKAHDANESVSLNEIRARLSKKFGFSGVPRLVDIISAVPDDYKKALLPKLKARPVRTASGVSDSDDLHCLLLTWSEDRRCRGNVQAASMSTYCNDWKYLRVRRFALLL